MASRPAWRRPLPEWLAHARQWAHSSDGGTLLNVDIFYDLQAVYGELSLGHALLDHAFQLASARPAFAPAC